MNRATRLFDALSLGSLGALVGVSALHYDHLPARMAVHFGLDGQPNGWMDRPYATWGFDAFAIAVWALLRFSPDVMPSAEWQERSRKSPMALAALLTALLLAGVGGLLVHGGLHPDAAPGPALAAVLGGWLVVLSVVLPRLRRNPLVGIRTPWTLTSDENWSRVHRLGSYVYAAAGLGCLVCGLVGATALGLAVLTMGALAPAVYSYVLASRLPPEA